ncbi:MAG: hypothetical protein OXH85_05765 [Truepera sp.]|nr:hypothetical protein [Truepera sp.]
MSRVVAAAASEALECTQPAIIAFTTARGDLTVNRNLEGGVSPATTWSRLPRCVRHPGGCAGARAGVGAAD